MRCSANLHSRAQVRNRRGSVALRDSSKDDQCSQAERPPNIEGRKEETAIQYRVLGPLAVSDEKGQSIRIGRGKQQALLGALLLRANRPVSTATLIDELWGARPPASAANALQVYVSKLRGLLEPERSRTEEPTVLVTSGDGYSLQASEEEVDVLRFERLATTGQAALASGETERAATLLAEALALWRGPALSGIDLEGAALAEVLRLEELRLTTLEARIEAELALRLHEQLVPELEALVTEHPLRERLRAQSMVALYRSGRQVDALAQYRSLRSALVDELGIEPSEELQRLEQAILRQDPALALPLAAAGPVIEPAAPARKPVTVVVVDLELSRSGGELDPEALQAAAGPPLQVVVAAIERHGGVAEISGGPTAIGVFGVPTVREDDVLRALRAAASLQAEAPDVAERLHRERGVELELRVGVASGEALVAGDNRPLSQRIAGRPLRDATRLAQLAAAGETLLGERTRLLARDGADLEAAGAGTWRLLEVAGDAPAIARVLDRPLVGRRAELALLEAAFDQAVGDQRVVLASVVGPPGIGKSRLVHELRVTLGERAQLLSGSCLPYGEGTTFRPVAQIVRAAVGDDIQAGAARVLRGERHGELVGERLAAGLGSNSDDGAPSPVAGPEQLFWAVRALLEPLARRRPLVVAVDDVHWAEPLLLDLLDYLLERATSAPLLLVVISRPELEQLRSEWLSPAARIVPLSLTPLVASEAEQLIDRLLGGRKLDHELRARVVQVSEGNPLFIEQMVAMVGEDPADAVDVSVPATIEALLNARLDLLPERPRELLTRAAVVGREFTLEALAQLVETAPAAVADDLDLLVRRQLLTPYDGDANRLSFLHELIREAAYMRLPKLRRADLHEQLADWLEEHGGEPAVEAEELIGHHLEQAWQYRAEVDPVSDSLPALAERASNYLGTAGERELARADVPAAAQLLARATGIRPHSDRRRIEMLLALGGALREIDDYSWAAGVADETQELATASGEIGLATRAALLRLHVRLLTESDISAAELLEQASAARKRLEKLGDNLGLAEAWGLIAWASWLRCRAADTEQGLHRAVEHAHRAGNARAAALNVNLLLGCSYLGPLPVTQAIDRCHAALAESLDEIRLEAVAYRALGGLHAMLGEFDEARDYLAREWALIDERRLRRHGNLEVAAAVELLAGDAAQAAEHLRQGCDLIASTGEVAELSTLQAMLAEALYRLGELDEAEQLTFASEAAASADDVLSQVQWRGPRAKILASRKEKTAAERLAHDGVELAESTDFLNLQGQALLDLAEVQRLGEQPAQAAAAIAEAAARFGAKGNIAAEREAHKLLERMSASNKPAAGPPIATRPA